MLPQKRADEVVDLRSLAAAAGQAGAVLRADRRECPVRSGLRSGLRGARREPVGRAVEEQRR